MLWFLVRWGLNVVALLVVAWLLKDIHTTLVGAIFAALVLGILNAIVAPILKLLTLPITIVTLGLFMLVINAIMFWLASVIVSDFKVTSVFAVIVGSILYSILTTIIAHFVKGRKSSAAESRN